MIGPPQPDSDGWCRATNERRRGLVVEDAFASTDSVPALTPQGRKPWCTQLQHRFAVQRFMLCSIVLLILCFS